MSEWARLEGQGTMRARLKRLFTEVLGFHGSLVFLFLANEVPKQLLGVRASCEDWGQMGVGVGETGQTPGQGEERPGSKATGCWQTCPGLGRAQGGVSLLMCRAPLLIVTLPCIFCRS